MPSGISAGAWGYSPEQVAGMLPMVESGLHPLTYELNLTSYPPTFMNGKFVSPLTIANKGLYTRGNSYGGVVCKKNNKSVCKKFLKNKTVNPTTGRPIKRRGKLYNSLSKKCKDTKKITKKYCVKFLESGKTINPLTGRTIKPNGTVYKKFMEKCKKYELGNVKENKLTVSGSLVKIPKKLDYLDLSESKIFKPPLPKKPTVIDETVKVVKKYPTYVKPNPSTFKYNGTQYTLQERKFISFNKKTFKLGNKAIVDKSGEKAVITNIGPKTIILRKSLDTKEKRIPVQTFIDLNN